MFKKLHLGASITRDGGAVSRHKTDPGPHTSDRERKIGERRSEPQRPTGTPQARHGPAHAGGLLGGPPAAQVPRGCDPRGFGRAGLLPVTSRAAAGPTHGASPRWCVGAVPAPEARPPSHVVAAAVSEARFLAGCHRVCAQRWTSRIPAPARLALGPPSRPGPGGAEQPGAQRGLPFVDDRLAPPVPTWQPALACGRITVRHQVCA